MLYNLTLNKVKASSDCVTCPHFDKKEKKCLGLGKTCFEYDPKSRVAIDPITKLPLKLN